MPDAAVTLIVGLGNPGAQYQHSLHNAGFWFVDELLRRDGWALKHDLKFRADLGRGLVFNRPVWVMKPMTYMNRSGYSVASFVNFYKLARSSVLVIHDDLDLAPGIARLKRAGGHGGHNGLRDLISGLGGNEFLRLRLGIGHPGHKDQVTGHVLGNASAADRAAVTGAIESSLHVLPSVLDGDLDKAMLELHSTH